MQEARYKRLKSIVRKLNQVRRNQAKKIDLLCNDLISAQKDSIRLLSKLSFVVDAYERLAGLVDTSAALQAAAELIKPAASGVNVAFFLLEQEGFRVHTYNCDTPTEVSGEQLGGIFTNELVREISKCNKVCLAEDMFAMGLQGNLTMLGKVCIAAIPLTGDGGPLGFILLYRRAENAFTSSELEKVVAITPGLSRTLRSCQVLSHSQGAQ